jgi:hypothetical protein
MKALPQVSSTKAWHYIADVVKIEAFFSSI